MASSSPTCPSKRSTRNAYLRVSSAYFPRSVSRASSPSIALAIDRAVVLQRRHFRGEVRHPGGILEADHRSEDGPLVDDGHRRDGSSPFRSVGELVGDLIGAQRSVLRH